ncbi:N-acetyltransferase [Segetibacter sp. 3557_3]|uniref:GNAT family N-acetyltransferase n=1 Tax=Segetibacter sp. 3557_3 TaxID=2547429 RepID=UPI0010591B1C|nr:GNAT family N-acetyltransferase [Segetibacter sp. 3557_3]TDH20701.1 N-acetyltransferase [Segetibacter sp. 3557_3]
MRSISCPMPSPSIQTTRLHLVPFTPAMFDELYHLFTHPSVRQYLLDDTIVQPEWVHDAILTSQRSFEDHGYGLWAIHMRAQNSIIGFCGFWRFEHLAYPLQLNYGLLPEFWNIGLATEASKAVIEYGFEQLDFSEIVAAADVPNKASFRVMERLGMRHWMDDGGITYFKLNRPLFVAQDGQ